MWCAENGVHAVVGTTGFGDDELADLADLFDRSPANAVIAPNFAIGAVLMMRFAELAAPYFESAEIIELHHDQKIDAPSGTAMLDRPADRGGVEGLGRRPDDQVRRRGRAGRPGRRDPRARASACAAWSRHQEVLLGTTGQTLSIRHDTYDRSSFMPGVLLAVHKVAEIPGLTIGLDALLGL